MAAAGWEVAAMVMEAEAPVGMKAVVPAAAATAAVVPASAETVAASFVP